MIAFSKKILLAFIFIGTMLPLPAQSQEKSFATSEEAIQALIQAMQSADPGPALSALLGAQFQDLWNSGDAVQDREKKQNFLKRVAEGKHLVAMDGNHSILYVGKDNWPLPIPLTKGDKGWYFDTALGKQEILNRRIGANELAAIATAKDFVSAELDYSRINPNGDKSYAQKFLSGTGKKDGLYWPSTNPRDRSPIDAGILRAKAEGYAPAMEKTKDLLYKGYFYRILTEQGKDAPGGARNYLVDGKLTQGFALLAYPAKWNDSGVMTFLVNQNGIVWQKNLEAKTQEIAANMTSYNPDGTWQATQP